MNEKQKFGRDAEQMAVECLKLKGYNLVERNWRTKAGEIDLIMVDGSTLVFVEVKARRSDAFGNAVEALTKSKQRKLLTLGHIFLKQNQHWQYQYRFDFVSIQFEKDNYQIDHYLNVIQASG